MRLQPGHVDASSHKVIYNRLRTAQRQCIVVGIRAPAVGMRGHLDCHIGVLIEYLHKLVERSLRFGAQVGLVVIIEYVFKHLWLVDRRQEEFHVILGILLGNVAHKLLFHIQVPLGTGKHHIAHAALQVELKRAVGLAYGLLVRPVVAHYAYRGIGHGILVLVEHITGNGYLQFGLYETEYVVVATGIVAVGTEEPRLALSECYAKVVGSRVDGRFHILHLP